MSMRHVLDAAEIQSISPSAKLAFMAICDDASDTTNRSYPGIEKVMTWSNVKKRRALELIALLIADGYLTHVSAGSPGRRAVYEVHVKGPRDESIPEATDLPVDNSEIMGAESRAAEIMGAENSKNARDIAPLSVDPLRKDLKQSSGSAQVIEPVDNSNDDGVSSPGKVSLLGKYRARKAGKSLDRELLEQRVADVFTEFTPEHRSEIVWLIALTILGKALSAGTKLQDPTSYIVQSIRREPEIHRQRAFEIDTRLSVGENA